MSISQCNDTYRDRYTPDYDDPNLGDAFDTRQVLVRYPRACDDETAGNADEPVGYHDDSFVRATLPTRSWHFLGLTERAGAAGRKSKWQRHPVGGEVYPGIASEVFVDAEPTLADAAGASHASYIRIENMFSKQPSAGRRAQALRVIESMGYVYHVPQATVRRTAAGFEVEIDVTNRGVVPFYYDWPVEVAAFTADAGNVADEPDEAPPATGAGPAAAPTTVPESEPAPPTGTGTGTHRSSRTGNPDRTDTDATWRSGRGCRATGMCCLRRQSDRCDGRVRGAVRGGSNASTAIRRMAAGSVRTTGSARRARPAAERRPA